MGVALSNHTIVDNYARFILRRFLNLCGGLIILNDYVLINAHQ